MRTDAHISTTAAGVRGGQLHRHVGKRFEGGQAFALSTGLGLPRTWERTTSAALTGFEHGLQESRGQDLAKRARQGMVSARDTLAKSCDQLVERALPDATLLSLLIGDGQLCVMTAGPGRVYLHRGGRPQRLTTRDQVGRGLLRARPSISDAELRPSDLLLAGSVTAFSTRAIEKVMKVLNRAPQTATSTLANLLTEPASAAGEGAVALVLRIV